MSMWMVQVAYLFVLVVLLYWHFGGKGDLNGHSRAIVKIEPRQMRLLKFFGRFTRMAFGGGYHFLPFPGIFSLHPPESNQEQTKTITAKDIYSGNEEETDQELRKILGEIIKAGAVRLTAVIHVTFKIDDLFDFYEAKDLDQLLANAAGHVLRDKTIGKKVSELFDVNVRASLTATITPVLQVEAQRWGIKIVKVYITEIDFTDPEVAADYQKQYRERMQRVAEVTETETRVQEAKIALRALGIDPDLAENRPRLEEELAKVRSQRISEAAANSGRAVVIALPASFDPFGTKKGV